MTYQDPISRQDPETWIGPAQRALGAIRQLQGEERFASAAAQIRQVARTGERAFRVGECLVGWNADLFAQDLKLLEQCRSKAEEIRQISMLGSTFYCESCPTPGCPSRNVALFEVLHALALGKAPGDRWESRSWRELLEKLDAEAPLRPAEGHPDRHSGWIAYRLVKADKRLRLERDLIRRAKRGDKLLRPKPIKDLETALELCDTIGADDRRIDALYQSIAQLEDLPRVGRLPGVSEVVERVAHELLVLLARAKELTLAGAPVEIDPSPMSPGLRLLASASGASLAGDPQPDELLWLGRMTVLRFGDRLQPLALDTSYQVISLLDRPLAIDADEVDALLLDALSRGLPIICDEALAQGQTVEAEAAARLLLSETADGLALDFVTAYRHGDQLLAEVDPDDPRETLPAALGERLVSIERDLDEERVLEALTEAALGAPLPDERRGDEALDFLIDQLPLLRRSVEVFGEEGLLRHRVRGATSAQVRIASGIDWFDLDLEVEADGQRIPRRAVLAAIRAGSRYVRLDDGAAVRLPTDWLARHGETLLELEAVRDADGRLGAFAAPLAAELIAEAAGDAGRWPERAAQLASFEGVPERETPPLEAELRSYQHEGFRWLAFLRDAGLGGCLADDMGLGKTIQAIALLALTHAEPGAPPSLVVAPTSVVHNWAAEANRFAPQLRVDVWHGAARPPLEQARQADVVITSYGLLRTQAEALTTADWSHAILDEAQQIKNPGSRGARAARALPARHRLVLTGTPLENDLFELWSQFEFLMPGFFGSKAHFGQRYAIPIQKHKDTEALTRLRARIRPFMLRRLKSEVAHELPPLQELVLRCELGEAQRQVYEDVRERYRRQVFEAVDAQGIERAAIVILTALTRLRQACCDVRLLPDEVGRGEVPSAKLDLLLDTLETSIAEGHRALVFSQWPSLLRLIRPELERRGVRHLYLDGQTRQRQALVEQWNADDGPPVFLISLKAGGTGLNLTGADHVIHLDPWWNPQAERQATDRAYRIGQTRPVIAYKLVAEDTVEEKVLELQGRKRALFDATLEHDRLEVDALTRDDLEHVFGGPRPAARKPDAPPPAAAPPLVSRPTATPRPQPPAPSADWPEAIDDVLARDGRLTNASVRQALGLRADDARAWLRARVEAGALEQRGARRGTHYVPCRGE